MNENDLKKLEKLNERFSPANLTGFKLIAENTDETTVLKHIEWDLDILSSCDVDEKRLCRLIVTDDCIDICTRDNGTYASYLFCNEAQFSPKSLEDEIRNLCRKFDAGLEILR